MVYGIYLVLFWADSASQQTVRVDLSGCELIDREDTGNMFGTELAGDYLQILTHIETYTNIMIH